MLLFSIPTPMRFLNGCSLVAWRQFAWVLHPAKILVLKCRQSLFKLLIFVPFVKMPRLLKFSIITRMQLSGFSWGACPYNCIRIKSPICCEIWFWAARSFWEIRYANAANLDRFLWFWVLQLSLWIAKISWDADGQVRFRKDFGPVSNWADCAHNLHVALDSAHWLPRWAWWSQAEWCRWQLDPWPLLWSGRSFTLVGMGGKMYDCRLVAT